MGLKPGRSGLPSPAIEAPTHVPFVILISFLVRPHMLTSGLHPTLCSFRGGFGVLMKGLPYPTLPKKTYWLAKSFLLFKFGEEAVLE